MKKEAVKRIGIFCSLVLLCGLCLAGCSGNSKTKAKPIKTDQDKDGFETENSLEAGNNEKEDAKAPERDIIDSLIDSEAKNKAYDLEEDLFLCPVVFDDDPVNEQGLPVQLDAPDYNLHFFPNTGAMMDAGSKFAPTIIIPEEYHAATEVDESRAMNIYMAFNQMTQEQYIPLFTSYDALVNIFSKNVRIGVVSIYDVRGIYEDCANDVGLHQVNGVVIDPGTADGNIFMTLEEVLRYPREYGAK